MTRDIALDLAGRALANIRREYPNHPQYLLETDTDAAPPRIVHPSFFGCFDWHSAVHTHWLLVRLLGSTAGDDFPLRGAIMAVLAESFHPRRIVAEADYLRSRPSFERPYGLAWAYALVAEVASAGAWAPAQWRTALKPLADASRANIELWLHGLRYPVRSGTHNQTAFALALIHDAAVMLADTELTTTSRNRALTSFAEDRDGPLALEPSGEDFLSPCLMEADLVSRFLPPAAFAEWLGRFLPGLPHAADDDWLPCAEVADERDGKSVHLHGLNLSRAWNLARIARGLPGDDSRRPTLETAAARHSREGVRGALAATDYASDHWLPTFVGYLLTRPPSRATGDPGP